MCFNRKTQIDRLSDKIIFSNIFHTFNVLKFTFEGLFRKVKYA